MKFSVATPTRNSIDKLKRCVGSVRGQKGVMVEHLVQDANSTDGTREWLELQEGLNYVSERDDGMYDAINKAWERSEGEILSWLNSDEQYLPGTLDRVAHYFKDNPHVDVLFSDYIVADVYGKPVALRREIPFRKLYVVNGFLNMQSATIFFRRKILDSGILKLNSRYKYSADKDLILRIASAGFRIKHIPEYWSVFGVDGTNLSTHPEMKNESEAIRLLHGAYTSTYLRRLVMLGRTFERMCRGGYLPKNIKYDYAINELPEYVCVESSGLGGRYSLADIEGNDAVITKAYK